MRHVMLLVVALMMTTPAFAQKSCDELKAEITQKLDAKGVMNYELTIVPTAEVTDHKVVGSCEGGSKKIIYKRN